MSHYFIVYFSVPVISNLLLLALHVLLTLEKKILNCYHSFAHLFTSHKIKTNSMLAEAVTEETVAQTGSFVEDLRCSFG